MVVRYFDILGAIITPLKTNTPLSVDGNAVLAFSVSVQRLQSVAGQCGKITERFGGFKNLQALLALPLEPLKTLYMLAIGKSFCSLVTIAPDHTIT
jgi:hypothetical protein